MSFVSSSIVGSSFVDGVSPLMDLPYNIVQLNGECIVDKLRIVDYAMTDEEFDALTVTDVYSWDDHTILYAEFTNNLNAGSIVTPSTIESWNIIRYCCGSNIPESISIELDGSETSIIDYTAIKGNQYYYKIYPVTATAVIAEIQSNTLDVCYDYYAFLDPTTGDSFTFKSNLGDMTVAINSSVSTYEGFTQYPAKSQGTLNYGTSTFIGLLGDVVSSTYVNDTAEMQQLLQDFITNGNIKIMKDRKGNIRKVFTESLTLNIDEKPNELPTAIAFTWTEVEGV